MTRPIHLLGPRGFFILATLGCLGFNADTLAAENENCGQSDLFRFFASGSQPDARTKLIEALTSPNPAPPSPLLIFDKSLLYDFSGSTHMPTSPYSGSQYIKVLDIPLSSEDIDGSIPHSAIIQLLSVSSSEIFSNFLKQLTAIVLKLNDHKIPTLFVGLLSDSQLDNYLLNSPKFQNFSPDLPKNGRTFGLIYKGHPSIRRINSETGEQSQAMQNQIRDIENKLKAAGLNNPKPQFTVDSNGQVYLMGIEDLQVFSVP